MTYQRITFMTILTYLWVMMILLGSVVLETFMIYPKWLRLAVNVVGSAFIFTGFLKFYRHSIMFNDSLTQKPSGQGG